jgi:hypothetical protein
MIHLSLKNAGLRSMDCDVPDCNKAKYRANFTIRLFCFICFKSRTSDVAPTWASLLEWRSPMRWRRRIKLLSAGILTPAMTAAESERTTYCF